MAQEIDTTFHLTIKQGKIEEFKELVEKLSKSVENNDQPHVNLVPLFKPKVD